MCFVGFSFVLGGCGGVGNSTKLEMLVYFRGKGGVIEGDFCFSPGMIFPQVGIFLPGDSMVGLAHERCPKFYRGVQKAF